MPPQETIPLTPPNAGHQPVFLRPIQGEAIRAGVLGLIVGLLVPSLGRLLENLFVRPVFCSSNDLLGACTNSTAVAYGIAAILCAVGATALLAAWQVFRPLPVALAALIALWGLQSQLQALATSNIWIFYGLFAVLYALAYLLFFWLLRLHQFVAGVVLAVVLVVAIRIVLLV